MHCLDLAERVAGGDVGAPLLDGKARAALRARLGSLREDLAEAERMNDIGRAQRAHEEIEGLVGALTGAFGLGGRPVALATIRSGRARQ